MAKWQVAAVVLALVVGGFGFATRLGTDSSDNEEARHQNKVTVSKEDTSSYRSWRLRVRPATSVVPTAAPSSPASAPTTSAGGQAVIQPGTLPATATEPTVGVDLSDDQSLNAGEGENVPSTGGLTTPVTSDPAQPSVTATPPAAPTPVAPDIAVVVVTSPAPTSIAVAVPDVLPQISFPTPPAADLTDPAKKDVAMQLVSSAENSSLDWRAQYGYIEDIKDGRGYTGGIIGFTSGTHDMLELVQYYAKLKPGNPLAAYIPALQKVDGSSSHAGLDPGFATAWKAAASDPLFRQAQDDERDRVYFNPAVSQAKADGLRALGQFIYYDAIVMHGPGDDSVSFGGIRTAAMKKAKTPAQGGDQTVYLHAFLDARAAAMRTEAAHDNVDRVELAQRVFLKAGNLDLNTPLSWSMYGDQYKIQ